MIVLASGSPTRAGMLAAAGVPFAAESPRVDEDAAKASLSHLSIRDLADALAELKALRVSARQPGALVLGCDSTLELEGTRIDKAESRAELSAQLARLSGRTHRLWSAAVLARDGAALWRHVEGVRLTVRSLSPAFIETYLDAEWPAVGGCVGGYRYEGRGVQLFERVEGSHFAVLGLPLLPLLAQLRTLGELAA